MSSTGTGRGQVAQLVVVLGSNTRPRERMRQAREALAGVARIAAASEEIEAPSYLAGDTRRYCNQALRLEWTGTPAGFAALAGGIERALGRQRNADGKAGADVEIDIDLVAAFAADGGLEHLDKAKLAPRLLRTLVEQVVPDDGRAALGAALG